MKKREMTVALGDETITLRATFEASSKICDQVCDVAIMFRELVLEQSIGAHIYAPRWQMTTQNVAPIIHIGMAAAGDKRSLAQVQDMTFDAGFAESKAVATEYIALFIGPHSEAEAAPSGGESSGE